MTETPTFEVALKELEGIVEQLERGQSGLDEAIVLWERGEELLRMCIGLLDGAQGKIEALAERAKESAPLRSDGPDPVESDA